MSDLDTDKKATHLVRMAVDARDKVFALQVRTAPEYEEVSQLRKNIKAKFNEIESYRVHLKEPHLEGCRRVDDFFRGALQALKDAENKTKDHLLSYQTEQKRLATEAQRKLDTEARKKREVLEAKASAEREKADQEATELKHQEEKARKSGDINAAITFKHEANNILNKAESKAETAEFKASQITAQKVEAYIPPVVGQHTKLLWKARVIDAKLVPDDYKVVDQKMLDAFAQATKGKTSLPGVEIYSKEIMSGR